MSDMFKDLVGSNVIVDLRQSIDQGKAESLTAELPALSPQEQTNQLIDADVAAMRARFGAKGREGRASFGAAIGSIPQERSAGHAAVTVAAPAHGIGGVAQERSALDLIRR